ncbi:MAG TPA: chemotaxis protein CheW [Polyangiaceae bacterium]|jgi:purine-binding chemotaxis protein CheW
MERQRRKDPSKNLVECIVADVRYAVTIAFVREIVNPLPTVALASAPRWIAGVADYRDEVVPVVDLRTRFGLERADEGPRTKWIVVRHGDVSFALVVDAVTEVFRSGDLRPAPALADGEDVRALEGVTTHDNQLVFILDVRRLALLVDPRFVSEGRRRTDPPREEA